MPFFSAHTQSTDLPLKTLLDTLENHYDVVFSYADEVIRSRNGELPDLTKGLDECLRQLTESFGLRFERMDGRYIAIAEPETVSFCAYLIDRSSKEPVEFAIINTSSGSVETSDGGGYFQIQVSDRGASLSISHIGYLDIRLNPDLSDQCDTIFLDPSISELDVVYVSNYLVRGLDKKPNGEFSIKTSELQVLPGLSEPDVLYTLQVLPGIQSPLESVSDINIRGGTNDQNLILWDGIRMFQSGHFYGLISAFNPYFTEEVTLTKNGSSSTYGESVAGTLAMHSTNEVVKEFSGGAGVNWLSGDLFFHIPISPEMSLSLAGRRSIADLIRTPTYSNYYERAFLNTDVTGSGTERDEEFKFYDLSGKLNFQPGERDQLSLSFIRIQNDLMYGEVGINNGSVESRVSSLTQESLGLGLDYSRTWNDWLISNIEGYFSAYKLSSLNNDLTNDQRLIQENEVLDVGLQADLKMILSEQISWKNGFQFEETGISNLEDINNPQFRRLVKEVMTRYIGFSELKILFPEIEANLIAGIRANYFRQLSEFYVEPRMVFRKDLSPSVSLELMGEFKNQTTSQIIDLQSDFLGVEKRRWILSNGDDIPTIRSKQVSGGLLYHKNKWLISAEAYYKTAEGITSSAQGFQNQFEFVRSPGDLRTYGGEFLISKQLGRLSGWASYTLSRINFVFPDLWSGPFPGNLDVRHNLNVGASYQSTRFEFSSGIYWHSGIPYTPYDQTMPLDDSDIQYRAPNSARLTDYMRVDLSGKYLFDMWDEVNAQLGVSFWNLTNYQNTLRSYFQTDENSNVISIDQKGLKFTPNLMFRVDF